MVIKYEDEDSFYRGVQEMVQRGLRFRAVFEQLEIQLTGGY